MSADTVRSGSNFVKNFIQYFPDQLSDALRLLHSVKIGMEFIDETRLVAIHAV
jgi:urease gamma subunit